MKQTKLKEKRLEKDLTTTKLEEMTGYTNGYISLVERGERTPSTKYLRKMSKILGKEILEDFF